MRLWHFSSSVNSLFEQPAQASSVARCLIFGRTLRLLPDFMCANSEGSGETARMRRLAWAFAGRLCDKYHNLMSWLMFIESLVVLTFFNVSRIFHTKILINQCYVEPWVFKVQVGFISHQFQ